MMTQLRPKVLAELRPGTRIVSHDYHFGDWLPDQRLSFQSQEKQQAVGFSTVSLYLWVVPANASGEWRIEAPEAFSKAPVTVRVSQAFQSLTGRAELAVGAWDMNDMSLRGRDIRFSLPASGLKDVPRHVFRGRVDGATMQGEVELAGERPRKVAWKATRVGAPSQILER